MALAAVSAVVFVSGVIWLCFRPGIPDWVKWEEGVSADATGQYEIVLHGKTVRVTYLADVKYDTGVIWTSRQEVKVQKALSCDIDNDGEIGRAHV